MNDRFFIIDKDEKWGDRCSVQDIYPTPTDPNAMKCVGRYDKNPDECIGEMEITYQDFQDMVFAYSRLNKVDMDIAFRAIYKKVFFKVQHMIWESVGI